MNIETAEDAIEAWKTHDGWEFADREAAWKWMFAQGRQAGRLDEREECALLCEWLAKDDDVPAGSIADGNECAISIRERAALEPRFANVSCSQCGRDFGPGDHGFSHCENHRDLTPNANVTGLAPEGDKS